ncbi:hypothetical protein BV504_12930 [Halomonas sp. 'Soap Lake |nr:hypothetical protein BV504_12930 [Halomonas sp. 'Soap Lake \
MTRDRLSFACAKKCPSTTGIHSLASYWTRRINEEQRMIYKATDDALLIAQLRYHY